jgi:hypothetical protein
LWKPAALALNSKAVGFSKTLVAIHKIMWCYISEDSSLLRVFKNPLHRAMFEHNRETVKRERRKLHNKEVYNLFSSPSKSDQIEEAVEVRSYSRSREVGNA